MDYSETRRHSEGSHHGAEYVLVDRRASIHKERADIPATFMEQEIVEGVMEHDIVIISGDTGCGKSTQVPQFLYEANFCKGRNHDQIKCRATKKNKRTGTMGLTTTAAAATRSCECAFDYCIGVTQPRRLAAISLADRVGTELNDKSLVGYQVRYDKSYNCRRSAIKFMTDGILLKEIQQDFLCSRYSIIILDEAHERSVHCDILIGLLSRSVKLRRKLFEESPNTARLPLRIAIMSATLRICDFTENPLLFERPPQVVNIPSRRYPVTVHFNKVTKPDYITEAMKRVWKIHRKLRSGSILVFVSGKGEVGRLCALLRQQQAVFDRKQQRMLEAKQDEGIALYSNTEELPKNELKSDSQEENEVQQKTTRLRVVPLYAALNSKLQKAAFDTPGPETRVVIAATNVAETSLTLPAIRYVVDTGKEKHRNYFVNTGVSFFSVDWISKSSCHQRTGRAGRVGPGHCFRLYSSAVYLNYFKDHHPYEILRAPLDSTLLFMASIGVPSLTMFPFPTPPSPTAVQTAREVLLALGALQPGCTGKVAIMADKGSLPSTDGIAGETRILDVCTQIGERLAHIPIPPRYGKILLSALARSRSTSGCCSPSFVAISCLVVATLSLGNIWETHSDNIADASEEFQSALQDVSGQDTEESPARVLQTYPRSGHVETPDLNPGDKHQNKEPFWRNFTNDIDAYIWITGAFVHSENKWEFCKKYRVTHRTLTEAESLGCQLARVLKQRIRDLPVELPLRPLPPSKAETLLLQEAVVEGLIDHVAILKSEFPALNKRVHRASYRCPELGEQCDVFIHSSSNMYRHRPYPPIIVYNTILGANVNKNIHYMRDCLPVDAVMLAKVSSVLVDKSDILKMPQPTYVPHSDNVVGFTRPVYTPMGFNLPTTHCTLMPSYTSSDSLLIYKVFAKAFCEGTVFRKLKTYKESYRWNVLQFITALTDKGDMFKFVATLEGAKCFSRRGLTRVWSTNREFLRREYINLFRTPSYKVSQEIASLWPPI